MQVCITKTNYYYLFCMFLLFLIGLRHAWWLVVVNVYVLIDVWVPCCSLPFVCFPFVLLASAPATGYLVCI